MRMALYQPEIPGNVGAVLRLGACFGAGVDIVEPTGFVWSDARLKRAAMDYIDHVDWRRHRDWAAFEAQAAGRVVLLTTRAPLRINEFAFAPDDVLLFGQESAGVPESVRESCDAAVRIPLNPAIRSLNLAVAAGIALAEALRQTGQTPA